MKKRSSTTPGTRWLVGIDTGGTYTDAAVLAEEDAAAGRAGVARPLGKAKALTTRGDLSVGIGEALDRALSAAASATGCEAADAPGRVALVSLSTTLATNAVVENLGDPAGLVLIGFTEADLGRGRLREALGADPVLRLPGGHDAHGGEAAPLDLAPLAGWLAGAGGRAEAYAVAGQFSVANPVHEIAVQARIAALTGKPATCGHELSSRLDAPRRAVTTLINARLIGVIHGLIDATERLLRERGIAAPLTVVKGDGSLMAAAGARRRPVETILSGPAASLVGAAHLTGIGDALVVDIGGTTTDVALLSGGLPRLDPRGARVGGRTTLVEAVASRTTGLGGDSEVTQPVDAAVLALELGPRRVVPVSLAAVQETRSGRDGGADVHAALDRQLGGRRVDGESGVFAVRGPRFEAAATASAGDDADEAALLEAVRAGPAALDVVLTTRRRRVALRRLRDAGLVRLAAFTPSDAAHVLGLHDSWDRDAAVKAATLFARRQTTRGTDLAPDAEELSRAVIAALRAASAAFLFDSALADDGWEQSPSGARASDHPLVRAALATHGERRLVRIDVELAAPVIALGASAAVYYGSSEEAGGDIAGRLGTWAVIPADADVANAVGAVAGPVRASAEVLISRPDDGRWRVHGRPAPTDYPDFEVALHAAEAAARALAGEQAAAAGASAVAVTVERAETAVELPGERLVLEVRVTATALGRPALASVVAAQRA